MKGLVHSPVRGPKGNIEFLVYFYCGTEMPGSSGGERDRPSRKW